MKFRWNKQRACFYKMSMKYSEGVFHSGGYRWGCVISKAKTIKLLCKGICFMCIFIVRGWRISARKMLNVFHCFKTAGYLWVSNAVWGDIGNTSALLLDILKSLLSQPESDSQEIILHLKWNQPESESLEEPRSQWFMLQGLGGSPAKAIFQYLSEF